MSTTADTLLLVDDDPTNLGLLVETLNAKRFQLLIARNGADALRIAEQSLPTLILLDVVMPGMDGFEVCERLKSHPATSQIKVIFLSALNDSQDKVRGLRAGAVDFIDKPFRAEEILARVQIHLRLHHLETDLARRNRELEDILYQRQIDLQTAAHLQQAMLPERLPECPHIETAWRYQPCEYLAGDFLNLVPLDEHHIALYVFDVSGHDVASALIAFTLARRLTPSVADDRSLLTDEHGNITPPATVAERLNRLYPMSETQPLYFTLLYGVLDTRDGLFRYVSAGQPGPIRVSRHQADDLSSPGMPIGLFPDTRFEEHQVRLEAGDQLLIFSDGLSEVRNAEGDVFGSVRLTQLAAESASLPLEQGLDHLLSQLNTWRGNHRHRDDMALLAVARRDPAAAAKRLLAMQFPARSDQLAGLREQLRQTLSGQPLLAEEIELIVLAVDEACSNIIQHGYGGDTGPIAVTLDHSGNELRIGIRDWAPTIVEPDRLCGRSLDELRPGGLGLHLMHCGVDQLQYRAPPTEGGNYMEMIKQLGTG